MRNPLFARHESVTNAWIAGRLKDDKKKHNDDNDFIVEKLEFLPDH